jgi:hypothetical protein
MTKGMLILASVLLAGCGNQASSPLPAPPPQGATNLSTVQPAEPGFGSAAVDVITQRSKVEAGKQAKATLEAAAARENKEMDAVLNEK